MQWDETALFRAASEGQAECVQVLLEAGAEPNKCNIAMATVLGCAVSKGSVASVRLLLEYGAEQSWSVRAQQAYSPPANALRS